jgi:hypothetical protein
MMTIDELKGAASDVARALREASSSVPNEPISGTGGGSRHRGLPEDLRRRFIAVRAELFQRGIFDPILVRFDTATVPQAPTQQIAEQLAAVADSLR